MRKLLVAVLGVLAVTAFWAVPAFADTAPTPAAAEAPAATGFVEVCKQTLSTPLMAFAGPASFTITDSADGTTTRSVMPGTCSGAITVAAGPVTVTEAGGAYYHVSDIAVRDANGVMTHPAFTSTPPNDTSIVVDVVASTSSSMETMVTFTNQLVTGFVEICKNAATGTGLTGTFFFTIRGSNGFVNSSVPVDVNRCSTPIEVPAGTVAVSENPVNGQTYAVDIAAVPAGNLISSDLGTATATLAVAAAAGNPSVETQVTFTDSMSVLKVCKVADSRSLVGTSYSFTVNGGSAFTIAAGTADLPNCVQVAGSWTAGTPLTVTEAATVGQAVNSIDLNGSGFTAASSAAGSVTFPAIAGVNIVTFHNILAAPVLLKVCKAGAGSGTFTIGATSIGSITAGQCSQPASFAYGSTLAISEASAAGFALAGTPTISGSGTLSFASDVANVVVGTWDTRLGGSQIIIVTFTNAAGTPPPPPPPPPTPTPTPPPAPPAPPAVSAAVSNASSTNNGGTAGATSTPTTPATATSLTSTPTVVSTPAAAAKVTLTKVLSFKLHGVVSRWLGVKLTGATSTAQVRIQLIGQKGKVISSMIRTLKTGKLVRVVKLGTAVRSIKVSALPPSA